MTLNKAILMRNGLRMNDGNSLTADSLLSRVLLEVLAKKKKKNSYHFGIPGSSRQRRGNWAESLFQMWQGRSHTSFLYGRAVRYIRGLLHHSWQRIRHNSRGVGASLDHIRPYDHISRLKNSAMFDSRGEFRFVNFVFLVECILRQRFHLVR